MVSRQHSRINLIILQKMINNNNQSFIEQMPISIETRSISINHVVFPVKGLLRILN